MKSSTTQEDAQVEWRTMRNVVILVTLVGIVGFIGVWTASKGQNDGDELSRVLINGKTGQDNIVCIHFGDSKCGGTATYSTAKTLLACQSECTKNMCMSFQYSASMTTCFENSGVPRASSGIEPNCVDYTGRACDGLKLKDAVVPSLEKCRQFCELDMGCFSYTYNNKCFGFGPQSKKMNNVASGNQANCDNWSGRFCNGLYLKSASVSSFQECQDFCKVDLHCFSYTYNKKCYGFSSQSLGGEPTPNCVDYTGFKCAADGAILKVDNLPSLKECHEFCAIDYFCFSYTYYDKCYNFGPNNMRNKIGNPLKVD